MVLGLLAAWQVFIGEVLPLTAIGLAIAAPVVLAHHREVLRPLARGSCPGAGVCLAIVAVPLLWWQFAGPRSYTSIWHPPGGNDLAQLWVGPPAASARTCGRRPRCR